MNKYSLTWITQMLISAADVVKNDAAMDDFIRRSNARTQDDASDTNSEIWVKEFSGFNPIEFKYAIVTSVVNAVDKAIRDGETDYETLSDIIQEAIE